MLPQAGKSRSASLLLSAGLVAALAAAGFPWSRGTAAQAAFSVWALFVGAVGFLLMRTGRTGRWRSLFFSALAILSLAGFKGLFPSRGPISEVSFCPIAAASTFLNHLHQIVLALTSGAWREWLPLSAGVFWLLGTLSLGRAWCSWGCFYGGLDDGLSRVLRRPLLKEFRLPPFLRDLPAAVLIASMVLSLAALVPIFCLWVCPFKLTTEFLGRGPERVAREILFVSVGIVTLIALPLLAKKRTFCGLICPFGAWQSLVGGLHPFRVTISPDRCTACGLCVDACPTMVLSETSLAIRQIPAYCNVCGECVDACSVGASSFTLWGRPLPAGSGLLGELLDVRVLVLFTGLLVGGSLGGAMAARIFSG